MNANSRACVVTSAYNDVHAMKRHLDSTLALGLFTIVVDGKYRGFEGDVYYSTDGMIDLVKSYSNTLYICDESLDLEELKNNAGFSKAHELGYEYVILLGADEYLEGDVDTMLLYVDTLRKYFPEQHLFNINVVEHNLNDIWNRTLTHMARLFHDPVNFEGKYTHWMRFYKGEKVSGVYIVDGITMHHDDSIRPKDRNEQMLRFQDWNVVRERDVLEENSIVKLDRSKIPIEKKLCSNCNLVKAFVYGKCVNCGKE